MFSHFIDPLAIIDLTDLLEVKSLIGLIGPLVITDFRFLLGHLEVIAQWKPLIGLIGRLEVIVLISLIGILVVIDHLGLPEVIQNLPDVIALTESLVVPELLKPLIGLIGRLEVTDFRFLLGYLVVKFILQLHFNPHLA